MEMENHLHENIEDNLHESALHAMKKIEYPTCSVTNTIITTSSGKSVTIIPKFHDYVLQSFHSIGTYLRVKNFWSEIIDIEKKSNVKLSIFFAPIIEFYDDIKAIKVKKVAPLNNFGVNVNIYNIGKIKLDICEALLKLGEHGFSHGDPRLDNVGYDLDNEKFVLFDYDKSLKCDDMVRIQADINAFHNSLEYHTK